MMHELHARLDTIQEWFDGGGTLNAILNDWDDLGYTTEDTNVEYVKEVELVSVSLVPVGKGLAGSFYFHVNKSDHNIKVTDAAGT